jgi:hypothetical protein
MAHLQLVAAQIAGKFMNQDHGTARSRFLEIKAHPIIRRGVRHVDLPNAAKSIVVERWGALALGLTLGCDA